MDVPRTRHKSGNSLVGPSALLPENDRPTLRDILAHGLHLKEISDVKKNVISNRDLAKQISSDLKNIWSKVNSKIMTPGVIYSDVNLINKIIHEWDMRTKVKNKLIKKKKAEDWTFKLDKLFNILFCHCPFKDCESMGCQGCNDSIHLICSCPLD